MIKDHAGRSMEKQELLVLQLARTLYPRHSLPAAPYNLAKLWIAKEIPVDWTTAQECKIMSLNSWTDLEFMVPTVMLLYNLQ